MIVRAADNEETQVTALFHKHAHTPLQTYARPLTRSCEHARAVKERNEYCPQKRDGSQGMCGQGMCGQGMCGQEVCGQEVCGQGMCGHGMCGQGCARRGAYVFGRSIKRHAALDSVGIQIQETII